MYHDQLLLICSDRDTLQGGTIRGSLNLPAQSLYPTIPGLYSLLKAAGVRKVIWYCGMPRLGLFAACYPRHGARN
jgi:arsenical-resistance protein 2